MGTCPTLRGQVTGSLPPGFASPKSRSATALPVSTPECQASRIAGTCADAQEMSDRTTGDEDQDHGLTGGDDRLHELPLLPG